jgi:alpha-L-arabinofuranosidase
MIGFDNQSVFGRTSYWVNRMMAENRPDFLFNTLSADSVKNLFCISGYDKTTDEIIIKVVNVDSQPHKCIFRFSELKYDTVSANLIVLNHRDLNAENSLWNPKVVIPKNSRLSVSKNLIENNFPVNSFSIIRIKAIIKK